MLTDDAAAELDQGPRLRGLPIGELRARRAALHAEAVLAQRWQRLLQARLDLAADAAAPVEDLTGLLPCAALRSLVAAAIVPDLTDDLRDVAAVRRQLHAYHAELRRHLAAATDELVTRYSEDPTRCLPSVPHQGGPPPVEEVLVEEVLAEETQVEEVQAG